MRFFTRALCVSFAAACLFSLWALPSPAAPASGNRTAAGLSAPAAQDKAEQAPFPALYSDAVSFKQAMQGASGITPDKERISGMILPHDLAALGHMAEGFARVRGQKYARIIILSGVNATESLAAIPNRDFATCLGTVPLDRAGAAALLRSAAPEVSTKNVRKLRAVPASAPLVRELEQSAGSAAVQALLPFVAEHFPGVPVLSLQVGAGIGEKELEDLAKQLTPLATSHTLVLLSANFSQGRTRQAARDSDQQSLRVIASRRPDLALKLDEPGQVDSRAALYLLMALQERVHKARPTVIASTNSAEYLTPDAPEPESATGFLTALYAGKILPVPPQPGHYFAAGDFFTGRGMASMLADPAKLEQVKRWVLARTGGKPLLINFEGVLLEEGQKDPITKGKLPTTGMRLWMNKNSTLRLLKDLNVAAASLANNHIMDFGKQAYSDMQKALEEAGILAPGQGEFRELPHFIVSAFTDLDNSRAPYAPILEASALDGLKMRPMGKPLAAMVHCGNEFKYQPNGRVRQVADMLEKQGVELFIGAHPHMPGPFEADPGGYKAWSLGNFLFDQIRPEANGTLLEIFFFPQGTYWVRQTEGENMYRVISRRK